MIDRKSLSGILITFIILFYSGILFAEEAHKTNQYCFRCHSMATFAYRDTATGLIKDLSVNPDKYKHANHADLNCIFCHKSGFESFPHPESVKQERLYCLNCHKDDPKFEVFQFPVKEKEFYMSVHYEKLPGKFNCFACHNPHEFKITGAQNSITQVVQYDNDICLHCHNSPVKFAELTKREFPDISFSHRWLPNIQLHWKNIRCVECHTPPGELHSHQILSAKNAQKNCVECHRTNSVLLSKLYKHNAREERERMGFINTIAFNEAYIIGMTRNVLLDKLSILLFGLVVGGIIAHAMGRLLFRKIYKRK